MVTNVPQPNDGVTQRSKLKMWSGGPPWLSQSHVMFMTKPCQIVF